MARDRDIIPGTEVVFRAKDDEAESHLVFVPTPSAKDASDPLNWSSLWKAIVVANQFVFVFVSIMTPLAIGPLTEFFMLEFHQSLPRVNLLFGVAAITLGYANFVIVPLANVFGRRPVVVVCGLICIGANIWQARVSSFGSFLAARVLSGLGAAANESIMPMIIADTLFLHQRGRSMALYFWAYFLGLFFGPIISGSIGARIGWRWFFWICAILQAASLVLTVVALPETRFNRASSVSESRRPSDEEEQKKTTATPAVESQPDASPDAANARLSSSDSGGDGTLTVSATSANAPPLLGKGAPVRWQWSLVPRARFGYTWSMVARDVVVPLQLLTCYPIVLWASLTMGFAANSLLALDLTQAQVFGAPPYNFSPAAIGYVNFAFAGGAVIALLTAGPLSDWVALRAARRNGGVLEAEMRLPALVPFVVANLVGMVVAAVGYQRGWNWAVVVVIGYGLVGIEVVGIPAIVIAYAVDSYKHLPGEIMIDATIIKNTFGFGMIFFYNDWCARSGYLAPVLMMMAVTVGLCILGLAIFIPYGKTMRRWTQTAKVHNVQ